MITYTINFDPVCKFTDEQFYQLCRKNPEIKFERHARGEIVITVFCDSMRYSNSNERTNF
ncbi:MAG: hypothetical protein BRC44_10290 [Cyanobacteria bacterium QS_4_48_99]|nr:MAG: hypothetical protein BRC44_10290 [Cyanobacteria bacterium QS_4_48_99]PSO83855.1 MAG: hypothetical protein BRC45_06845 [Cyanobacteria bacterium QS_5_48_63]